MIHLLRAVQAEFRPSAPLICKNYLSNKTAQHSVPKPSIMYPRTGELLS